MSANHNIIGSKTTYHILTGKKSKIFEQRSRKSSGSFEREVDWRQRRDEEPGKTVFSVSFSQIYQNRNAIVEVHRLLAAFGGITAALRVVYE